MHIGRIIVLSIIAFIYALAVCISYYFGVDSVLYFAAFPWSIIATFMSAATHTYSGNKWLLIGGILNLVLYLWFCLFKPMLNKKWEVPD
jgi:hypothetical protein